MNEQAMASRVRTLFERYEFLFNQGLAGNVDMTEVASLYATEFIAASPAGVATGKNDDQLRQVMGQGYAHYRAIGTKAMGIREVVITPIDDLHCLARVAWTATYRREGQADLAIDFEVHYLVQDLAGEPKVFGWVSGDEQALLKDHGIV